MHKLLFLLTITLVSMPGISLAGSDIALARAADNCNSAAYDTLKPQRKKSGARELMNTASNGKKYAKWMKKYYKLIDTCATKPYLSDCKPATKIAGYHVRVDESKKQLEDNMLKNYLCNSSLVNKLVNDKTSKAAISSMIETKVNEMLKAGNR